MTIQYTPDFKKQYTKLHKLLTLFAEELAYLIRKESDGKSGYYC